MGRSHSQERPGPTSALALTLAAGPQDPGFTVGFLLTPRSRRAEHDQACLGPHPTGTPGLPPRATNSRPEPGAGWCCPSECSQPLHTATCITHPGDAPQSPRACHWATDQFPCPGLKRPSASYGSHARNISDFVPWSCPSCPLPVPKKAQMEKEWSVESGHPGQRQQWNHDEGPLGQPCGPCCTSTWAPGVDGADPL